MSLEDLWTRGRCECRRGVGRESCSTKRACPGRPRAGPLVEALVVPFRYHSARAWATGAAHRERACREVQRDSCRQPISLESSPCACSASADGGTQARDLQSVLLSSYQQLLCRNSHPQVRARRARRTSRTVCTPAAARESASQAGACRRSPPAQHRAVSQVRPDHRNCGHGGGSRQHEFAGGKAQVLPRRSPCATVVIV